MSASSSVHSILMDFCYVVSSIPSSISRWGTLSLVLFVLSFILMNFHSCELKWFGIKLGFIFVLGLITSTTTKKERK